MLLCVCLCVFVCEIRAYDVCPLFSVAELGLIEAWISDGQSIMLVSCIGFGMGSRTASSLFYTANTQ